MKIKPLTFQTSLISGNDQADHFKIRTINETMNIETIGLNDRKESVSVHVE